MNKIETNDAGIDQHDRLLIGYYEILKKLNNFHPCVWIFIFSTTLQTQGLWKV